MSLVLTKVAFNWPKIVKNNNFKTINFKFDKLRASFTNSLHDRKPSFGVKIVLSGFTKEHSDELAHNFCAWPDWICFCSPFPFQTQNVWEKSIND